MIPLTIDFSVLYERAALARFFPLVAHVAQYAASVCHVSSRDQPLPFLSGLRKASLEPSVSQAAKCIGEEEQGNLELMSILQEETEGWDATQTDCRV